MSCHIILVRHGQSEGNDKRVFCGHLDWDITPLGVKQAERVCEYLKGRKIDAIFSSDLMRAYHTAEPLSRVLHLPITKSRRLRELFAGDWEGKSVSTLLSDFSASFAVWKSNIGLAHPENGESVMEVQTRVYKKLTELAQENEGKTIAVFTHATPIRSFFAFVRGMASEEMKHLPWASNASVSEVVFEDGAFQEISYSTDDFMGELVSYVPKSM